MMEPRSVVVALDDVVFYPDGGPVVSPRSSSQYIYTHVFVFRTETRGVQTSYFYTCQSSLAHVVFTAREWDPRELYKLLIVASARRVAAVASVIVHGHAIDDRNRSRAKLYDNYIL